MTLLKLLRTFSAEQENEKEAIRRRRRRLRNLPEVGPATGAESIPIPEVFPHEQVFMEFFKSIRNAVDEDPHLHYLYQIMPTGIS